MQKPIKVGKNELTLHSFPTNHMKGNFVFICINRYWKKRVKESKFSNVNQKLNSNPYSCMGVRSWTFQYSRVSRFKILKYKDSNLYSKLYSVDHN